MIVTGTWPACGVAALKDPVRTDSGLVRGAPGRDAAISVYKGLPYAAPPLGPLRWKAPEPPAHWSGVRDASRYGPDCPSPRPDPSRPESEDCLTLNVWTGAATPAERRPVLVWIFGGAYYAGSGADPVYDGEALARKGVIVVTCNYRLGVLGFLATPELSAESGHHSSGNYGLLDDIAVLKWVQRNIAAFGGDPTRVTVGGQSAGAGAVGFLEISPMARGLFSRSLKQSGVRYPRDPQLRTLAPAWKPLKDAEADGAGYVAAHGAHSLAELRALPWQQLIAGSDVSDKPDNPGAGRFRPIIDRWLLPYDYEDSYGRGVQNDSFVIAGGNKHEQGAIPDTAFDLLTAGVRPKIGGPPAVLSRQVYVDIIRRKFGAFADEFFKLYPAATDREASLAYGAAAGDSARVSAYLWAQEWRKAVHHPTYIYYWTHAPPDSDHDINGAYHGSEMYYMFGNLLPGEASWTSDDRRIADRMTSYWANFVATGDPNGAGLPRWPGVDAKSRNIMELGDRFAPMAIADAPHFEFWQRYFAAQDAW
jgi:para-nitrobenzyl esterase